MQKLYRERDKPPSLRLLSYIVMGMLMSKQIVERILVMGH
jgi:hypothetical protein